MDNSVQYIFSTGIPTLAVIIVGYMLSRQIKSQKEMLNNYKDYIEATDWKKVKAHFEEVIIPNEIAKAQEEIKRKMEEEFEKIVLPKELQKVEIEVREKIRNELKGMFLEEFTKVITEKEEANKILYEAFKLKNVVK